MNEVKGVPINLLVKEHYSSLVLSTLELFNGIPTSTKEIKKPSKKLNELTVERGFVFSPQVIANYKERDLINIVDTISKTIGITPEQMNSSFNKSWKKVRDAPTFQLLTEQIFHYMTTYGYEQLGSYNENTVFIPSERLDVPDIGEGVKLTVINGFTKKQLKEKLTHMLNSGIALDDIDEITEVADFVKYTDAEVLELNNKEVRCRLYNNLDLIPSNPIEFLRLCVFKTTDKTLLINNRGSTELIKKSNVDLSGLFKEYDEYAGYKRLAEIFNRFKPLFLAFRSNEKLKSNVNKISHLAKIYHKPMTPSLLNDVTGMLSRHEKVSPTKLSNELENVNIFRKIRLAQSLKYRMTGNEDILYKVRNGKAFATKLHFDNIEGAEKVYKTVIKSIAQNLKHLKSKEFYIPENIFYSLPSTAKQFSGNIPTGSYVNVGKDMIFGVYWENVDAEPRETQTSQDDFGIETNFRNYASRGDRYNDTHNGKRRIDLDLHGMSQNAGHIGWNTTQRSGNRSLLRTGDITDAPNGATELFYINKDYEDMVLFTLNYYNFDSSIPVPYKLMIADEHVNSFGSHYTIDPKNMKCLIHSTIDKQQVTLGLGAVKDGECRFYFSESGLGNTNVVKGSEYIEIARNYMAEFFKNQITFNEVLEEVGGNIVRKPTKKSIDLSPENLQKDTFINLLVPK